MGKRDRRLRVGRTRRRRAAVALAIASLGAGALSAPTSAHGRRRDLVGTAVVDREGSPVSVTIGTNPTTGRPTISVCEPGGGYSWTSSTWCTTGPLWDTLSMQPECVIVAGRTWYAGDWVVDYGGDVPLWWSFEVVDRPGDNDHLGLTKSVEIPDGPCGAGTVVTRGIAAGELRMVRRR